MNYLLTFIFTVILSFLSLSQKMIYNAENLSVASVINDKASNWSKPTDVDIVVILDIDSSNTDVKRKFLIYSNEYREYDLGEFEYSNDDKNNYIIVFEAYDIYNESECKITLLSIKKKSYLVIEYDDLIIKYLLNEKYSISNMPKSEM